MPSTFLCLHYHLVFSTQGREPFISQEWSHRLHEYLGGTTRGLGGHIEVVGGVADHVHLLFEFRATHPLADFVRELKKMSSKWIHEEIPLKAFAWQEGYAAFTVSASARVRVRRYIENQEEHHRKCSFRDELRTMLRRSGVNFDERYLD